MRRGGKQQQPTHLPSSGASLYVPAMRQLKVFIVKLWSVDTLAARSVADCKIAPLRHKVGLVVPTYYIVR
jgi:hypothetical protein